MKKPAITSRPIHDLLHHRWSPLAFEPRSLNHEQLLTLVEAARWAPSCFNEQPWRFLAAVRDDAESFAKLLSCLVPFNQTWAQNAGALLISVAAKNFARNGSPNFHYAYDAGQAAAMMTVQATALGLIVHQMGGFDRDKTRQLYAIPDDYEPIAAMAVGYQAPLEALPESLHQRESAPRSRKELAEIVFSDQFGQRFSGLSK